MLIPEPKHVGKPAEFLIIAEHNDSFYMRAKENWLPWDGDVKNLQTAIFYSELPHDLKVQIFEGDLSNASGEFIIFVGYRLEKRNIIYNGNKPIQFFIED